MDAGWCGEETLSFSFLFVTNNSLNTILFYF